MEKGDVVLSLFGHDKGRKYLIFSDECDRILCVDGKLRKLCNPKQKNLKHLKKLSSEKKFLFDEQTLDCHVKKFLKNFEKEIVCLRKM